jgi:putative ABC transport system substrate-binding protein
MRRRDSIRILAAAAAWPFATRALTQEQRRTVAVLMGINESPYPRSVLATFEARLRELGWASDRNLDLTYRWSGNDIEKAKAYARELVAAKPDLIVGHTDSSTAALLAETTQIPIVFVTVSDPIELGFLSSLSAPGRNATGSINFEPSLGGKWFEILSDLAPDVRRVMMMYNPSTAPRAEAVYSPSLKAADSSRHVETVVRRIHEENDIERALAELGREPGGGLVITPDNFVTDRSPLVVSLLSKFSIPAIHPYPYFPRGGGLASYGVDPVDSFRKVAFYIDAIFRGAKPKDLPVQLPTKFQLIINLGTAKRLGLDVPPRMLATADQLID